jgi:hypothetical protein
MIENIVQKLAQLIFLPKLRKVEHEIGYKLVFRDIPPRYINGWVSWDMTKTFKKFGLAIEAGANYWTMGKIVRGDSSRYDQNAPEYQSWLGGYAVKLVPGQMWGVDDHFKLAIADQNSWLRTYGDPNPMTNIAGWKFTPVDAIQRGEYSGTLFDWGCTTDSDVGNRDNNVKLYFESIVMAALFNLSNPNLHLEAKELRPNTSRKTYKTLRLHGYIAIFDVAENVKVVLYGNGAIVAKKDGATDTFIALKNDLLTAMQSCEIVKA